MLYCTLLNIAIVVNEVMNNLKSQKQRGIRTIWKSRKKLGIGGKLKIQREPNI